MELLVLEVGMLQTGRK